jgi:8-oxo-dGTP diphosphatase
VLLARRPQHAHQGGLWEFPGGKVEPGETRQHALARELHEELGILPSAYRPLIQVPYRYPDKAVHLDVWQVQAFDGIPEGRQGQPLAWVPPRRLHDWPLPAANRPICTALRLPQEYLITPEPSHLLLPEFLQALERSLLRGVRLVQLRAKQWDRANLPVLAREVLGVCRAHGAALLLNGDPATAVNVGADGIHLSARVLAELGERPLPEPFWVGASCHGPADLKRATFLGADFAVLSPVLRTASHPERPPLGWPTFGRWAGACPLPVYALGGVGRQHLDLAWQHGGQGIAGIRGLWNGA